MDYKNIFEEIKKEITKKAEQLSLAKEKLVIQNKIKNILFDNFINNKQENLDLLEKLKEQFKLLEKQIKSNNIKENKENEDNKNNKQSKETIEEKKENENSKTEKNVDEKNKKENNEGKENNIQTADVDKNNIKNNKQNE